jgi:hypothetical protein
MAEVMGEEVVRETLLDLDTEISSSEDKLILDHDFHTSWASKGAASPALSSPHAVLPGKSPEYPSKPVLPNASLEGEYIWCT